MTEPHDRLWCEWFGAWHDADASKPKPSYEGWLEKRLEADMQRARAELATEKRLHELTVSGYRTRLEAAEKWRRIAAMLRSVVKSGEPWTTTLEAEWDAALAGEE